MADIIRHVNPVTNIPQKSNMAIISYDVIEYHHDQEVKVFYRPVYGRVHAIRTVYSVNGKLVYLINDSFDAFTTEGKKINLANEKFTLASNRTADFEKELAQNGLKIIDGRLVSSEYWFPQFCLDCGFIPVKGVTGDKNFQIFNAWDEAFATRAECANWCNHLNDTLRRNYPEIA